MEIQQGDRGVNPPKEKKSEKPDQKKESGKKDSKESGDKDSKKKSDEKESGGGMTGGASDMTPGVAQD